MLTCDSAVLAGHATVTLFVVLQMICLKKDQEKVVGLHLTGPNAGEIAQGFCVAMRCVQDSNQN